jgi:hypothetical protein
MKKKIFFVGTVSMILIAIGISFNVSHSDRISDISLLSIKAMTNAAAECTDTTTQGLVCYEFANGITGCLHGGEPRVYCAK